MRKRVEEFHDEYSLDAVLRRWPVTLRELAKRSLSLPTSLPDDFGSGMLYQFQPAGHYSCAHIRSSLRERLNQALMRVRSVHARQSWPRNAATLLRSVPSITAALLLCLAARAHRVAAAATPLMSSHSASVTSKPTIRNHISQLT